MTSPVHGPERPSSRDCLDAAMVMTRTGLSIGILNSQQGRPKLSVGSNEVTKKPS